MGSPTLFDAIDAREEAIARSGHAANPEWLDYAHAAVICCASSLYDFTTDDVRALIPANVSTHEPSALGHVVRACARAGLIRKTGVVRMTRDPIRHRDLTVWCRA